MNTSIPWQYDEFRQVGQDYASQAEVAIYDQRHGQFRDLEAESNKALDMLGVKAGDVLIDLGAGTGNLALFAARRGVRVHAVDISPAMLAYAESKLAAAGVDGVSFHHAGLLTYEHPDTAADAVHSTFVLHHLPDFWKGVALKRIHAMLKPGGRLYLRDVVMEEANAIGNIDAFIAKLTKAGGDVLREDTEMHFRDEFSTYDWVMDGMLERAGFRIVDKQMDGGVIATYVGVSGTGH